MVRMPARCHTNGKTASQTFPPLTEAAKHQAEKVLAYAGGTLAGFRSLAYAQGLGVAGFHLRFLRDDKQAGGHCLDFSLRAGSVQICTVHGTAIGLPASEDFLKTAFEDPALGEKVKEAEA